MVTNLKIMIFDMFLPQYDRLTAEVCVPKLGSPQCSPVTVKGVGTTTREKCLQVTRTVCTQAEGKHDESSVIVSS